MIQKIEEHDDYLSYMKDSALQFASYQDKAEGNSIDEAQQFAYRNVVGFGTISNIMLCAKNNKRSVDGILLGDIPYTTFPDNMLTVMNKEFANADAICVKNYPNNLFRRWDIVKMQNKSCFKYICKKFNITRMIAAINFLNVDSKYHGKHIGSNLVYEFENSVCIESIRRNKRMAILVETSNFDNYIFYEKMGYSLLYQYKVGPRGIKMIYGKLDL